MPKSTQPAKKPVAPVEPNQSKSSTATDTKNNTQINSRKPLRFVIVGILNTVLDFGLMNCFKLAGLNLIVANTLSTGIAMVFSFFMNKRWTFRNAGQDYARQVVLFFIFTMIGIWVIQNGFIWLIQTFVPHFGLPDQLFANAAKLVASVPSLVWNYLTYNSIVFKNSSGEDKRS